MSPVRERMWMNGVLLGGSGETPGWADPWFGGTQVGILMPVGARTAAKLGLPQNVGAGIFEGRAFPTEQLVAGSGVSYNATTKRWTISTTVTNKVIVGFVTLTATGVIENCHVSAPATEYTAGFAALVEGPATSGQGIVRWCTIAPNLPSAWYDGVGRGILISYSDIFDVVDHFRAFSTSANGVRINAIACDMHSAAQFRPDYAYSGGTGRAETHNDIIQAQGNPNGDDDDLSFYGCRGDARHSLSAGTIPATRAQIAAIMITPASSQGAVHMAWDWGWLLGGMYCVNAGSDGVNAYGPSSMRITYTRFERPGTNIYGDGRAPDIALACDPSLIVDHHHNTYIDNGATVPRSNA